MTSVSSGPAVEVRAEDAKHTPGPWRIQYGHETGYPRGIYAPGDANKKGAVGCVVRFNGIGLPSSEAGQANARLIAAAPDLYEAALLAEPILARLDTLGALAPDFPALAKVRAALSLVSSSLPPTTSPNEKEPS